MFFRLLLLILLLVASPGAAQPPATEPAPRRLSYQGWGLAFADEFDTYSSLADFQARSPWQFHPDGGARTLTNNAVEDQYYEPAALSLQDGRLVLTATRLPEPIVYPFRTAAGTDTSKLLHYQSGWISTRPDFYTGLGLGDAPRWPLNRGFEYGLFEIRCRFGSSSRAWPAFWLFNGTTEIDVFEGGSNALGRPRLFSTNVHHNPAPPARSRTAQASHRKAFGPSLDQEFHTYSVVWTPTAVTFYFDGRRLRSIPARRLPTLPAPVDIIANQAMLGYSPALSPTPPEQEPPSQFEIEYIRVYKPQDGSLNRGHYVLPAPSPTP
ncbi:family 16 glycosylhydrolase [Hymenobacter sp. B81]|uniref:glycoside hydrolase family 16 protein n=1 Tax=Hymenobacter sp. B81 TaxID=3344878 RepID=UPI0037DCF7CB